MVVVDPGFRWEDTNATANVVQAYLVEFEAVPSQGLGTGTRGLGNRDRDAPVPALHDHEEGGGGKARKGTVKGTPYVKLCNITTLISGSSAKLEWAKKVKSWLRMEMVNES